jgi:KDO2-lipid IV(A) lauroyltransferase
LKKPAIQILLEFLSHFPIKFHYILGGFLGFFVARTPNQISAQTDKNIRLCFDQLDRSKQLSLAKNSIRHTCYSALELAAVWCWPVEKILAKIQQQAVCDQFRKSQKGRLVIAPHLGSWELLNIWLAENGRLISLYKPQRNARVDNFILKSRCRNGAQLVPTDASGLRKLIKGLKRGATVMILPDQKPRRGGARIDSSFFGHAVATTPLIQNFCEKIDCDVFIAAMYRAETSSTFSLSIESLEHYKLAAPAPESAQYLNDQIESMARTHLDQYQWGYERFTRAEYDTL